jgi:hypothetical protein
MDKRHFTRTLSLMLAAQFALSPVAFAQATTASQPTRPQAGTADIASALVQTTAGMLQNISQAMQQEQMRLAAENQANQLKNEMNPENCGTPFQPAQCTSEIFPGCLTLNTYPNLVEPAQCEPGAQTDYISAGVAKGFSDHFTLMQDKYRLFNLESNNSSNVGIGCLNREAEALQRRLQGRVDEVDRLIGLMRKQQDAFKAQSENDRNTIDEAMALLEGDGFANGSQRGKAALEKNSVRFGDAFKNNAACASVLDNPRFNTEGKRGGFKGIRDVLEGIAVAKTPGSGSFSAMEFNGAVASRIEQDLQRMLNLAGRQVDSSGVLPIDGNGFTSAYGLNRSPAVQAALAEQAKIAELDKADITRSIEGLGAGGELVSALDRPTTNYEALLENFERSQKNACLSRNSNIQNLLSNELEMIDPNVSEAANDFSDNAYRTFVLATLNRSDISIERKMDLISAEERKSGNRRFIVNTQASGVTGETTVKAKDKNSPANFIKIIVENCKKQFEENDQGRGATGRQIVQQMRNARSKMMNYQKVLAGKMKNAVLDRVKNCNDSGQSNATGVAVCSSRDLSTSSESFCIKRANACATNMRQCLSAAEKQVETITKERDKAVGQYQANLRRHEETLRNIYLQTEGLTSLDGMNIAAALRQPFVEPTDLKFEISQEERTKITGLQNLDVNDPEQYFTQMTRNLESLKRSIQRQNRAVMNGPEGGVRGSTAQNGVFGHIENIKNNMRTAFESLNEFKSRCQAAYQAFNQQLAQQQEQQRQQQEERQRALSEYCMQAMSVEPGCESAEQFDGIVTAAQQAGDAAGASYYSGYRRFCRRTNPDTEREDGTVNEAALLRRLNRGRSGDPGSSTAPFTSIAEYCSNTSNRTTPGCNQITPACSISGFSEITTARFPNGLPDTLAACRPLLSSTPPTGTALETAQTSCQSALNSQSSSCTSRQQTALGLIADYLNETPATGEATSDYTGENRSTACAAFDNSSGYSIGKALQEVGNQFGQAAANGSLGLGQ